MPPLDYHQIRLLSSDIARRPHDVKRIRRVKQILCALYFEAVIAVIPLFLMKQEFGVLHFIGDHLHIVPFCQLSTHESRVVGDTAFVGVYRPNHNDFFTHMFPLCSSHFTKFYDFQFPKTQPAFQDTASCHSCRFPAFPVQSSADY